MIEFNPSFPQKEVKFPANFSNGAMLNLDYEKLKNLPQIEGKELVGNKTAEDLGLAKISDIPTVPTNISAFNNDKGYQTEGEVRTAILENVPTSLSDLEEDMMHRTVTDTEKSNWNGKADASSVYTKTEIDAMLIMDITETVFGGEDDG